MGSTVQSVDRAGIAASQITALLACERRMAVHLDPESRSSLPSGDLRFRAGKALDEIVRYAHEQYDRGDLPLELALIAGRSTLPHADLSPEENHAVSALLNRYIDAFDEDQATLDIRSATLAPARPSQCGRFELRGTIPIVVSMESGLEARRLILRRSPSARSSLPEDPELEASVLEGQSAAPSGVKASDVALAVLLRVEYLRVIRLYAYGDATPVVTMVGRDDIEALRANLRAAVDQAWESWFEQIPGTGRPTRPGWWCTTCPSVRHCPAVPQERIYGFERPTASGPV